jgi:hypothetical protein
MPRCKWTLIMHWELFGSGEVFAFDTLEQGSGVLSLNCGCQVRTVCLGELDSDGTRVRGTGRYDCERSTGSEHPWAGICTSARP